MASIRPSGPSNNADELSVLWGEILTIKWFNSVTKTESVELIEGVVDPIYDTHSQEDESDSEDEFLDLYRPVRRCPPGCSCRGGMRRRKGSKKPTPKKSSYSSNILDFDLYGDDSSVPEEKLAIRLQDQEQKILYLRGVLDRNTFIDMLCHIKG